MARGAEVTLLKVGEAALVWETHPDLPARARDNIILPSKIRSQIKTSNYGIRNALAENAVSLF